MGPLPTQVILHDPKCLSLQPLPSLDLSSVASHIKSSLPPLPWSPHSCPGALTCQYNAMALSLQT